LRRTLAQIHPEWTCIATVPGRGYRFVAPLRVRGCADDAVLSDAIRGMTGKSPAIPALIGREEAMNEIVGALAETRLLTIVGPPGVGKTSMVIAAARQVGNRLKDGVCFVDLAAIDDSQLVTPAIAFALGLDRNVANTLAQLVEILRDRELLLILDNCEHVLSAAATIADHLNHALQRLLVVTTSREPLRCRRESVYRLSPLRYPPPGSELDPAAAITFSAIELLVRRAEVHGYRFDDADAPSLMAISRHLDGIALAIELAAPRLSENGAAVLADLLENAFDTFVSQGNAATPRHMTLKATLDWSYGLLTEPEGCLLRHLSVYGGTFTLNDVIGVCNHLGSAEDITVWLESLAIRSLLSAGHHNGHRFYRLLDSTRSFASQRLRGSGEDQAAMASYARYLLTLFEKAEIEWNWRTREDWIALYGRYGNDLRRAIDWSFGKGKDSELGVRLTVVGIPLWHEFSSIVEIRSRLEVALSADGGLSACDQLLESKLLAARAISLCHSRKLKAAEDVLRNGMRLSNALGNAEYHIRMALNLSGVQFFSGRGREALTTLSQLRKDIDAASLNSAAPDIRWHELMVHSCCGDLRRAHRNLSELADERTSVTNRSQLSRFAIDRFVAIRTFLALPAWSIGQHRRALDLAEEAAKAAATLDRHVSHAYTLCLAAIPVALLSGLYDVAQRQLAILFNILASSQNEFWPAFGRFYKAMIDATCGDSWGLTEMRAALDENISGDCLIHAPMNLAMLADVGLINGQLDVARRAIAEAIDYAGLTGERWCEAELRRIQGLVHWQEGDTRCAERLLQEAIQLARRSGALSFELRAATSFAEIKLQTGRDDGALAQLAAVFRSFDSSFHSADLVAARTLLESYPVRGSNPGS
jgi:predicted ATPase